MRNKSLIFYLFSLAQILFLGHSIIPHQHVEPHSHNHTHNQNGHDHDHSNEGMEGISHFFFNFSHSENNNDFFGCISDFEIQKETSTLFSNGITSNLTFDPKIIVPQKSPPEHNHSYCFNIFLPPGLRGPPISVV
jgi:hypothetical protein